MIIKVFFSFLTVGNSLTDSENYVFVFAIMDSSSCRSLTISLCALLILCLLSSSKILLNYKKKSISKKL